MGVTEILKDLRDLGLEPTDRGDGKVSFPYVVPVGKFQGEKIELGIKFNPDFPLSPPGGPHVKPMLLPLNNAQGIPHPSGAIHKSEFGDEWEYWSRPFPDWPNSGRTVRAYMAHVRGLFATQ